MTQAPIETRHKDMAANMLSQSYDRILTIAQTLANDEAKGTALAEIDRIAGENEWPIAYASDLRTVAAIAAPYRASDPVADGLRDALWEAFGAAAPEFVDATRDALTKRGLEIVERRDR